MRVWRFNEKNEVVDAAKFDDSFILTDSIPVWVNSLSNETRQEIIHHLSFNYDYLCLWKGEMFLVDDVYTRRKEMLEFWRNNAEEMGLLFKV